MLETKRVTGHRGAWGEVGIYLGSIVAHTGKYVTHYTEVRSTLLEKRVYLFYAMGPET